MGRNTDKKKKKTNITILNDARSIDKLSFFLDPVNLLTPKKGKKV